MTWKESGENKERPCFIVFEFKSGVCLVQEPEYTVDGVRLAETFRLAKFNDSAARDFFKPFPNNNSDHYCDYNK